MRVISGTLGGRRFNPPHLTQTRPTTDFAKTGLFNILNNHFDFNGVSVLDLFSGTGSISYEFLSRGSRSVTSVEKDERCVGFIQKMKKEWKLDGLQVIKSDVFRFIDSTKGKYDLIFAGPPYALSEIDDLPGKILHRQLLNEDGWFILETSPKHSYHGHPHLLQVRNYGQTHFHFFSAKPVNIIPH